MTKTRSVSVLASAVALAVVLAGCSSGGSEAAPATDAADQSWEATVERASAEGMLNLYSGLAPAEIDRLVAAFNQEYPEIEVVVTRGAYELLTRVDGEIAGGTDGADVMLMSVEEWYRENQDDLAQIDVPSGDEWPAWAIDGYLAQASYRPFGFLVWNTDLVPDGLTGWEDLLDPEIEGVAAYDHAQNLFAAEMEMLESTQGEGYLKELGEHNVIPFPSLVPAVSAVGSGEAMVSIVSGAGQAIEMKESGAPVDFIFPDPTIAVSQNAAILKKSQRPNASLVFVDFMLSEAGQVALSSDGYGSSPKYDDIPGAIPSRDLVVLDESKYTSDALAPWQDKYDEYFGK